MIQFAKAVIQLTDHQLTKGIHTVGQVENHKTAVAFDGALHPVKGDGIIAVKGKSGHGHIPAGKQPLDHGGHFIHTDIIHQLKGTHRPAQTGPGAKIGGGGIHNPLTNHLGRNAEGGGNQARGNDVFVIGPLIQEGGVTFVPQVTTGHLIT